MSTNRTGSDIAAERLGAVDWPELAPLVPARAPAPFPIHALPRTLADYVQALAETTQTPPDLAGLCVLGVVSACAGGRVVVEVRPGWREPVNIYAAVVMPPASRKSAVISSATRPLYDVEVELTGRMAGQLTEARTQHEVATKAAENAVRNAAKATPDKRDQLTAEAVSAASAAAAIDVPASPRLIADDATPEAAQTLLAQHDGRMAFISAEGGLFDVMAGRYSNNVPNLDVWLKGHAGDPLRVDRKGRPPEKIDHPALTLLLTVQPGVLDTIRRNREFRGRGLTARFLFALPTSNIGRRKVGAAPVPEPVQSAYADLVTTLARDLAEWTDPAVLTFTIEATGVLLDIERRIEPELDPDGALGHIPEWGGKLAGATVRIAALLHLAGNPNGLRVPIPAATVTAADEIGRYLAEHASAALSRMGVATETSTAIYLVEHLVRHDIQTFTVRRLHAALSRGRFPTVETVTDALAVLAEHGWVVRQPDPPRAGPGRKPSPTYLLHPEASTGITQYTEPAPARDSVYSADCVDGSAVEVTGPSGAAGAAASDTVGPRCLGCERGLPAGAEVCADCYRMREAG